MRVENNKQAARTQNELIEEAFFKLAVGCKVEEITYKDGMEEKRVCKEKAPNFTALKLWLETHLPEKWKAKTEAPENEVVELVELVKTTLAEMSSEELKNLLLKSSEHE